MVTLSQLIAEAQKALAEHGDLPVYVETCHVGYEHNIVERSRAEATAVIHEGLGVRKFLIEGY